ncbi:MAG TPA: hypothetical protein VMI53_02515, partial [Opitutaceae bacterium]|nr:hypothetical protein [Opitutaceae bacterium]
MKSIAWKISFSAVLFSIGVCVGWFAHSFQAEKYGGTEKIAPPSGPALVETSRPVESNAATAKVTASQPAVATEPTNDATLERLKALSWLNQNKLSFVNLRVFGSNGLAPSFIRVFGLSDSQVETLNRATQRAKNQEFDLERKVA